MNVVVLGLLAGVAIGLPLALGVARLAGRRGVDRAAVGGLVVLAVLAASVAAVVAARGPFDAPLGGLARVGSIELRPRLHVDARAALGLAAVAALALRAALVDARRRSARAPAHLVALAGAALGMLLDDVAAFAAWTGATGVALSLGAGAFRYGALAAAADLALVLGVTLTAGVPALDLGPELEVRADPAPGPSHDDGPARGRLVVRGPTDALVFVDDAVVPLADDAGRLLRAPNVEVEVPAGVHVVRLRLEGEAVDLVAPRVVVAASGQTTVDARSFGRLRGPLASDAARVSWGRELVLAALAARVLLVAADPILAVSVALTAGTWEARGAAVIALALFALAASARRGGGAAVAAAVLAVTASRLGVAPSLGVAFTALVLVAGATRRRGRAHAARRRWPKLAALVASALPLVAALALAPPRGGFVAWLPPRELGALLFGIGGALVAAGALGGARRVVGGAFAARAGAVVGRLGARLVGGADGAYALAATAERRALHAAAVLARWVGARGVGVTLAVAALVATLAASEPAAAGGEGWERGRAGAVVAHPEAGRFVDLAGPGSRGHVVVTNTGRGGLVVGRAVVRDDPRERNLPASFAVRGEHGPLPLEVPPGASARLEVEALPSLGTSRADRYLHLVLTTSDEARGEVAVGLRVRGTSAFAHLALVLAAAPLAAWLTLLALRALRRAGSVEARVVVALSGLVLAAGGLFAYATLGPHHGASGSFAVRLPFVPAAGSELHLAVDASAALALVALGGVLVVESVRPDAVREAGLLLAFATGAAGALLARDLLVFATAVLVAAGSGARLAGRRWVGASALAALVLVGAVAAAAGGGPAVLADGTAVPFTFDVDELSRSALTRAVAPGVPAGTVLAVTFALAAWGATAAFPLGGWARAALEPSLVGAGGSGFVPVAVAPLVGFRAFAVLAAPLAPEATRALAGLFVAAGVAGASLAALTAWSEPTLARRVHGATAAAACLALAGAASLASTGVVAAVVLVTLRALAVAGAVGAAEPLVLHVGSDALRALSGLGRRVPTLGAPLAAVLVGLALPGALAVVLLALALVPSRPAFGLVALGAFTLASLALVEAVTRLVRGHARPAALALVPRLLPPELAPRARLAALALVAALVVAVVLDAQLAVEPLGGLAREIARAAAGA